MDRGPARWQGSDHRDARPVQRQDRVRGLQPRSGLPDRHGHRHRGQDEERRRGATGNYSGGNYTIVCNEPTQGNQDGGKTAMESCLSKNPDINVVYTINEPAAAGASSALQAAGETARSIVSVDGGCDGVASCFRTASSGHLAAVPAADGAVGRRRDHHHRPRRREARRCPRVWSSTTPVLRLVTDKPATASTASPRRGRGNLLGLNHTDCRLVPVGPPAGTNWQSAPQHEATLFDVEHIISL